MYIWVVQSEHRGIPVMPYVTTDLKKFEAAWAQVIRDYKCVYDDPAQPPVVALDDPLEELSLWRCLTDSGGNVTVRWWSGCLGGRLDCV